MRREAMHLTLHFFGEIPEDGHRRLRRCCSTIPPFAARRSARARAASASSPRAGSPRVLWVGLEKGVEEMRAFWRLHGEAGGAPQGGGPLRLVSGLPRVSASHHGGTRRLAPLSAHWADGLEVPSAEFLIAECVLFQSILGPGGARYVPLKTIALRGGSSVRAVDLIVRKRDGAELAPEEIDFLVRGFTRGEIPDYQFSALLMAIVLKGMTPRETARLTRAMIRLRGRDRPLRESRAPGGQALHRRSGRQDLPRPGAPGRRLRPARAR